MAKTVDRAQEDLQAVVGGNVADFNGLEGDIVTLSIKKTYPNTLVDAIVASNESAMINETDEAWQIRANFIRVTRAEVEKTLGFKIPDSKWRILFMNREGQVNEFDNFEFSLGVPKPPQVEEAERKEWAQLNVRIEKKLKEDMEKFRNLVNLNQNDFVAEALSEYIAQLTKELI